MRPNKLIHAIKKTATAVILLLPMQLLHAEIITVPLKIDFPLLQHLVIAQLFNNESVSKELLNDPDGCSEIILSDPKFSEQRHHLKIISRLNAKLGAKIADQCTPLLVWQGHMQIIGEPVKAKNNPQIIYLRVIDSELTSLSNERLTSGPLWDQAKKLIPLYFERFQLDLAPSINEIKSLLPLLLPRHTQAQLNHLLETLHLADMQISADGIHSELIFDITAIARHEQPVQALTKQEQLLWQQKWQSMDALLTNTIKYYAAATKLDGLRMTLFDILINARYGLQDALQQDQPDDPVRHWFINSWTQLIPVMKQISAENPQYATLGLMTIVTATDVLHTLDKLGPALGLDISVDGLRRLARMLNNNETELLNYNESIDLELQRLFHFHLTPDTEVHNKPTFNFWPISVAFAANDNQLNNWVPKPHELDTYLSKVHKLLLHSASQTLADSTLDAQQQEVFRKLILATAWQESCWRQYIIKNNKIVPIRSSSGDTGIMQVNEIVWRGFVNQHKLRWDIAYNANAGSEILLNYMTRYVIPKGEHKHHGGIDNLARATYSAYNGGPGKITRYRDNQVAKEHRKIDRAFYDKYLKVKQNKEMTVAQCLGGVTTKLTNRQPPQEKVVNTVNPQQQVNVTAKQIIYGEKWIKQQDQNYFTLQLGVFSSSHSAKNLIHQQQINGNYALYRLQKNKQDYYGVIYGRYATKQHAKKESMRFKQIKPWIRPFKAIRESMNF